MPTSSGRSARVPDDAGLRLPRPPGVIRRFWARHPLFADILIAVLCLLLSLGGAAARSSGSGAASGVPLTASWVVDVVIAVLIVAGCAAVPFRRRVPLLPFTLAVALQLTTIAVPHGAAVPLLVVTTYSLAVYGSNRLCAIAATGATVLVVACTALALVAAHPSIALPTTLNTLFNTGFSVLLGALVGVNVGNRRRYLQAVLDRSRQLLVERDQQAELAAAAERERIAREMHDIVSHSLTVIVALAEGAAATADPERARHAVQAAASTARTALTEMRAMLGVLRSDDPAAPLTPMQAVAPEDVVAAAQRAGFPVVLSRTGVPVEQPSIRYAVGRIVQEGLTNAMRHAPAAHSIRVHLVTAGDRIVVTVANDGVTATASAGGFGIRGLVERARHVGGTLTSAADGDGRWLLRAELPLIDTPTTDQKAPS
mgnify:CR=1 FL=1